LSLKEYKRKRKFTKTPEPQPKVKQGKGALRFVVQKHDATRTHYDFRLELDGVLKSWAIPKGPSLTSGDPRLAVYVEDHPMDYGGFEGVIPKGNYGAGTVMVWDQGTYIERGSKGRADSEKALRAALEKGHLTFLLSGEKLEGEFALVKIRKKRPGDKGNAWLLIKKHDAHASRRDVLKEDRSALTGRTMEAIAEQSEKKGAIWLPGKGYQGGKARSRPAAPKPKPATQSTLSAMPRKQRPMEPAFAVRPPTESGWSFEAFGIGLRAIAEVEPAQTKLYSRTFLSMEKKFPSVVAGLRTLGKRAVLDGELVREGKQSAFVVSDLLFIDGKDLRSKGWTERRKLLEELKLPLPLRLAPSSDKASEVHAGKMGFVVAKRLSAPYQNGLTKEWVRFRAATGKEKTSAFAASEKPPITHPDKIFWPKERITKGDLVAYYEKVADTILPYLVDRPQSMHRQPDGIRSEGFFHKDMSSFLPRRISTERVFSASSGRTINYVLCQDKWALLYMVNLGCIELNPWLSRRQNLENPDYVVIDLDPDGNPFKDVVKVARAVHAVLEKVGAESFCKTSGSSGLHICIPTDGKYGFDVGRLFAENVCKVVQAELPKLTSVDRNPAKRRGRIYLDFLQNRRAQTLAAPYCVRPRPGATVSTPLKWSEVKAGLSPEAFTIQTLPSRLKKLGDLWAPMLKNCVDIESCAKQLLKKFHI
jgi:bifunctional non-homologous end joining protein LigD